MRNLACLSLLLLSAAPIVAQAQGFPPFPVMSEMDYPRDIESIRARADAGEGYATLVLASMTRCEANDPACEARAADLYRLASRRGQPAALAMLRLRILKQDPSRASEFSIGSTVCGRTRSDAQSIVRQIAAIELPDYEGEFNKWQVKEALGSSGSQLVGVSRGPIGARLVYSGDRLRIVRVFTDLLSIVNREGAFEAVQRANAAVASAVCPRWPGLGEAIPGYIVGAAVSWPPQAVHVDGPSAWLAATGVTPDIVWFDLYVDPLHDPFTSGTDEKFQPASGLGLAPAPEKPR